MSVHCTSFITNHYKRNDLIIPPVRAAAFEIDTSCTWYVSLCIIFNLSNLCHTFKCIRHRPSSVSLADANYNDQGISRGGYYRRTIIYVRILQFTRVALFSITQLGVPRVYACASLALKNCIRVYCICVRQIYLHRYA